MKDTKKKYNSNNIINWIFIFGFLAFTTAIIVNYIDLKNPTIQGTAVFVAGIVIIVAFMLIMWLDAIQQELYDIKNSFDNIKDSLDDLYDIKQINDLRSIVNKRHLEKLLNDMEEKINEENKY